MNPVGLLFVVGGMLLIRQVAVGRVKNIPEDLKAILLASAEGDSDAMAEVLQARGENVSVESDSVGSDSAGTIGGSVGSFVTGGLNTALGNWGTHGDSSNMVTVSAGGCTFTVHKQAASRFQGLVNDLVKMGYKPTSIGGFSDRPIAGTSTWSNHAYGAAIDIDPSRNPRYGSAAGGPYALPKPASAMVSLARKWGCKWGGEYRNSKDYMHFEVLGAPATS